MALICSTPQSGERWEIAPRGVCCFRFSPDGADAVPTQTVWLRGVFWCHRIAVGSSLTEQALTTMPRWGVLCLYQPLVLRGKLPIILQAELVGASLGNPMNHHKYPPPPLPSDIFLLEIDFFAPDWVGNWQFLFFLHNVILIFWTMNQYYGLSCALFNPIEDREEFMNDKHLGGRSRILWSAFRL